MCTEAGKLNEKDYYTEEDYMKLSEELNVELIDGEIYEKYPDSDRSFGMAGASTVHQDILSFIHAEIYNYIKKNGGKCRVYIPNYDVKLFSDRDTVVQPDVFVVCDPGKLTDKRCEGAPDWIVEIVSPGNAGNDYVRKLNLYMDAGVREYWIVDPMKKSVAVYQFSDGQFVEMEHYTFSEKIKAGIYDDLYIDFGEINIEQE